MGRSKDTRDLVEDGMPEANQSRYENLFAAHVLPIARFRRMAEGKYQPITAIGTGFTFGERLRDVLALRSRISWKRRSLRRRIPLRGIG
jgi:hypothetical protein